MEKVTVVCVKCGKILTRAGRRLQDAYFDSRLRDRKEELLRQRKLTGRENIIYAWCHKCWEEEKSKI